MALRERSRFWATLLAAWLLAIQVAAGGPAAAGRPAQRPAAFDPLAVYCSHDGSRPEPGPAPVRHPDDCCLAGCISAAALPPAAAASSPPRAETVAAAARGAARRDPDRRPAASPATIRGPPGRA